MNSKSFLVENRLFGYEQDKITQIHNINQIGSEVYIGCLKNAESHWETTGLKIQIYYNQFRIVCLPA